MTIDMTIGIGDIIAGLALIVAIVAAVIAQRASKSSTEIGIQSNNLSGKLNDIQSKQNELDKEHIEIRMGQLELQINERISSAKEHIDNVSMNMPSKEELEADEEKKNRHKKILESAIEQLLNCYEEACAKYIDNKVDRIRFQKIYRVEIRKLVEDKTHNERYFNPIISNYKAILKVYDEWENMEK